MMGGEGRRGEERWEGRGYIYRERDVYIDIPSMNNKFKRQIERVSVKVV